MGMGVLNDPLDVVLQDNDSVPVEHFLYQSLNAVTVLSGFTPGSKEITLSPGHNFVAPDRANFTEDFINIEYTHPTYGSRIYQSRVVAVAEDVITVGVPVGIGADVSNIVLAERVNTNMAVSGTVASPIEFRIESFDKLVWDIQVLSITMILSGQPDDGLFGDQAALANGIYVGQRKFGLWGFLENIIDNGEFAAFTKGITYSDRTVPLGSYGIYAHKELNGPGGNGVVVRLRGTSSDRLSVFVQDDLSGLVRMRIKAFGHTAVESPIYDLNPFEVVLTKSDWVKVAEGVQSGTLIVDNKEKSTGDTTYHATMVAHLDSPPSDDVVSAVLPQNVEVPFNRRDKVDVYVKSTNKDSKITVRI